MQCESVCCSYPSPLHLGAVRVPVQTGEDGSGRHELTRLVPAVSVTDAGRVVLTLLVQDGVQSVNNTCSVI